MTFDVTPKQLHDFGPIYGKAPSRFRSLERFKHERRALAYRKCKLLFPWSRWAAQSAIDDYGAQPSRIHVIPPGVDIDRWNPGERFERPAKPVCDLLFVGGDFERKGGDLLLEWVLRSKRSDFVLHLVTRKRLDQFADPRIRVYNDLMPNDSCLVKLYSTADIFVLPTRADCYSLAGIEAMASGLPVIVGQTGGTGDIIRHGETGLLIGTNDMESLGESLDRLIADFDLRRRIGMAAREDAVARYNGRRNIRESVELMRAEL
jgi:glycosyltransferase involved in cell wall biosynthesis